MDRLQLQKIASLVLAAVLASGCAVKAEESDAGAGLHHDGRLRVGFGKADITPLVIEGYDDANGNNHFDTGEKTHDVNGNGVWEPQWIAGFSNGRAAQGVHDRLWARTLVMERDGVVVVYTSMDLIGMLPTRMAKIRRRVIEAVGRKYDLQESEIILASTHTHESPDAMGIWGEAPFTTGINEDWMLHIEEQAAQSIVDAFAALAPATVKFGYARAATWINDDSRYPFVIDDEIHTAQFVGADGATLGTLVEYSMHPEVLWSQNTLITSDFPHYVRERIEQKLGGTAVYATGMVGGLMTPLSDTHTFEQAALVGHSLADSAIASLAAAPAHENCELETAAQRVYFPVDNGAFRVFIKQKILDASEDDITHDAAGCDLNGCVDVESVAVQLCGVAQLATVPGELFPELGMGGYAQPLEGVDERDMASAPKGTPRKETLKYPDAPTEPPLRAAIMDAEHRFVFGLANGELGYIVPKSQWDQDYEETVSLGPDTAPRLLRNLEEVFALLRR